MSELYPDLGHTQQPKQCDKQMIFRDPTASEIPLVNQQHTLIAAGQTAAGAELLMANPSLQECMINADKLLSIYHAVVAVERFFYDNVLDKIFRLGNLKGDWNILMSSTADGDNKLNHFDVVRYPVDGVIQYFLVQEDGIVAGEIPTESDKYIQISMKGDKGDPGYTPVKGIDQVDGIDGAPGLGLSPSGAWVNNKEQYQYDLVSHNGLLWYALADNIAEEPVDGSNWQKINITLQVTTGTETPVNLEDGGLWLHMQDDGHIIMKTKNEDGDYTTLMPETQAKQVFDEIGESLQKKIYRHYFDRDDVKITMVEADNVQTTSAALLDNPTVVVAKAEMTDTLDTDGTVTEEFTVQDETGVYVMQKCRKVYTDDGSGTQTCTPEVIV